MNNFEEQDYNKKFDLSLWVKLLKVMKQFKKELIVLVVAMVLVAIADATFPLLTRYAIDNFIANETTEGLPAFLAVYISLVLALCACVMIFIRNSGKLETGMVYAIRKMGFKKLQELSFSYFDNTPVGWIMARMTSDAQRLGDVIGWSCLDLVWGTVLIVIVCINMFILNAKLALIVLISFPILILVSFYFQTIILKNQREVRKINSKITGAYNEGINGARTTKTLVREERNYEDFKELSGSMRKASVKAAVISAVYFPIILSMGSIGVGLVLWLGGGFIEKQLISLGTYMVFISYATQVYEPVQQLARVFAEFQSAQAAAERTLALIETEPDITDPIEIIEKYGDATNPKPENWPEITGDIVFENVSFSYKTGEKILEDFNLHIKKGEKIALVGETGAGKSTIVNLICRFYEPTAGRILIDGVDYRDRSQIWLQSNLGYVLQSPHLFSGTVSDNIRYAKLDATDDEIEAAAKAVSAYDFIMKLENGMKTEVGEGGSRLSSGQKQLVSFARAIIANPKIFVLDEATSSIDTETEQTIQSAVYSVLHGRTSFIVAHRLSTIRTCDRILVIHGGKIIESGSHKELLKQRGHYYSLYTNQFKAEAENKLLHA